MDASRHLHVACAIVEQDGLVLAAQRSSATSLPLKWEFPGGKIEPGASPEQCLLREMHEEMAIRVAVDRPLARTTHYYDDFTVTLYPFCCRIIEGEIILHEHAALCWLPPEQLHTLDWAAADLPVICEYQEYNNGVTA